MDFLRFKLHQHQREVFAVMMLDSQHQREVFAVMMLDSQHRLFEFKEMFFGTIITKATFNNYLECLYTIVPFVYEIAILRFVLLLGYSWFFLIELSEYGTWNSILNSVRA
ncbi:hypothetical protein [Shewanella xiamenensis]|uniref:hypothetical protein n=1 Tax=Shewanella xiamenensis TaxID=332186 RepID=UPI0024A6D1BC|nr:hypothetical protein [Shewanella xiamenensis]MDI5877998.1 hypothetical protein [Shewanella xiamenensis]